jgi:hypothetical protein
LAIDEYLLGISKNFRVIGFQEGHFLFTDGFNLAHQCLFLSLCQFTQLNVFMYLSSLMAKPKMYFLGGVLGYVVTHGRRSSGAGKGCGGGHY